MAALKLRRLPDRQPIKITLSLAPELHQRLQDYTSAYFENYGTEEPIAELVPAMLAAFLDSDREFSKRRSEGSSRAEK